MPPPGLDRRRWLVVVGSLMLATVVYAVVLTFMQIPARPGTPEPWMRLAFPIAGAVSLLLSIGWTRTRVPNGQPDDHGVIPEPAVFATASIAAMGQAEASAVLGFIWCILSGGGWRDYMPFGLGALLVLGLVCLPRGLTYWSAWEARQASPGMH